MGLGLAVSYGIIRRHEGTVDVESQIGAGTVFRIRLPIPQSGQTTSIVHNFTAATLTRFNSFQTRILVVDDEEYVRDLLRDILEKEGCRVTIADGGRQALTLFDQGNFDAVFTDVGMPDMNGWELSRAVRQRDPRIPVAVITGWGEAVGSYERQAAQVNWVVTKPFDRSQIVEMAQEVLRRRDPARRAEVAAVAA
jgi:CheY-like chemotaxis protein